MVVIARAQTGHSPPSLPNVMSNGRPVRPPHRLTMASRARGSKGGPRDQFSALEKPLSPLVKTAEDPGRFDPRDARRTVPPFVRRHRLRRRPDPR